MVTYKIHLIRHARAEGGAQGRYIGRTDLRLSADGIKELELLRRQFQYPRVELVVASPLQRCVQTADLIYPDTYTEMWEDFIECDFGAFEGKSVEELRGDERFLRWVESGMTLAPEGGESSEQILCRAVLGLDRLFRRMMEERIYSAALVTHGGILTAMLCGMGLPKRKVQDCAVANGCGYTVLMTPQLWMRERAFEIYGVLPYGMTESQARRGGKLDE